MRWPPPGKPAPAKKAAKAEAKKVAKKVATKAAKAAGETVKPVPKRDETPSAVKAGKAKSGERVYKQALALDSENQTLAGKLAKAQRG